MTEQRRSGITRQIIQVLEDNQNRALTIERISQLVDYNVRNTASLINQLRKNRPNIIIESPTTGVYIYRGTQTVDEVLEKKVTTSPVKSGVVRSRVVEASVKTGDLMEVIGFSQDLTPLVRDGVGTIYRLQHL